MNLRHPRPTAARSLAALLAIGAACTLSACATDAAPPLAQAQANAPTPVDQYPLRATQAPTELALAVHPGGLSANQGAALSDFANHWREGGAGSVMVRAPADGPNAVRGREVAQQTADALVRHGVPARLIQLGLYPAAGSPTGPVVVSFLGYVAEVPDCSRLWGNVVATKDNLVMGNFGCSVHANMAAMIADPSEIVRPHAFEAGDGDRRADVLAKYRQGKKTSSDRDEQARGSVSSVAQ